MGFLQGNAQHIGSRHSQQDSFGFTDPDDQAFIEHAGFLAIVCDGMGGMEYGDAASHTAVRAFLDAYRRKTSGETIPDALERSVHEANDQVLRLASSLGLVEGIGTTLIAAALYEQSLFFVSVGDSGLFLVSNGEIRMVNRPHIFANVLDAAVTRGNMSPEDAANHPERESLTSYIGAQRLEEIDRNIDPFSLDKDDAILLASDGLFKTLSLDEIHAGCIGPPQSWPEMLVASTIEKQREYQDNVTVLSMALESARTIGLTTTGVPRTVKLSSGSPPAASEPAAPPAWTDRVQAQVPPFERKRSGMLIPLIVIVLVIVAGAGWWYFRQHRSGAHEVTGPGTGVQAPHRDPLPEYHPDPKDVKPPLPPKELK
jgi:serine/threonine protein phosphatase PrpC